MDAEQKKTVLIRIAYAAVILALLAFLNHFGELKTYRDHIYGFAIKYPRLWRMAAHPQPGAAVIFGGPQEKADKYRPSVNITIQNVPAEVATLKAFSDTAILQMKVVFKDAQVLESKEVRFGKHKGYRVLFYGGPPDEIRMLNVWAIKEASQAYILTYMAFGEAQYKRHLPFVERMIKSFRIFPRKVQSPIRSPKNSSSEAH